MSGEYIEWRCLCGAWVSGRFYQHIHAELPPLPSALKEPAPDVGHSRTWICTRTQHDETRVPQQVEVRR